MISTPDRRRKERICHINLIRKYHRRENKESAAVKENSEESSPQAPIATMKTQKEVVKLETMETNWSDNESFLVELPVKLVHLPPDEREELSKLLQEYEGVFRNTPGRTTLLQHDVDVREAQPVKQRPYRVNPRKAEMIRKELDYMLKNDLIEPCTSEWSSPITLVV